MIVTDTDLRQIEGYCAARVKAKRVRAYRPGGDIPGMVVVFGGDEPMMTRHMGISIPLLDHSATLEDLERHMEAHDWTHEITQGRKVLLGDDGWLDHGHWNPF